MTVNAVVIAAHGECVDLELMPRSCSGCSGACLWKRLTAERLQRLHTDTGLPVGTEVSLSLPERSVLTVSVLLHGVPLAALLVGAGLGAMLTGSDWGTLLGAVASVSIALYSLRSIGRRLERRTLSHLLISAKS